MRKWTIAWVFVLIAAPGLLADDAAVKKDLKALEGTWQLEKQTADGKEAPAEDAKKVTVVFDAEGKWEVLIEGKKVFVGTVQLDPSKTPKTADWTVTEGEAKDMKALGIYEVSGDSFKHCFAAPGKERPTKFESKEGSGITYGTYKRVKK